MAATAQAEGRGRVELPALSEWVWAGLLIGAFALYYASPWLPLSLALLALCAALCYVQLPLAVSLTPLAMPFFMLPKHLGHEEFALGETAIVLCAAAYVLRRALEPAPAGEALHASRSSLLSGSRSAPALLRRVIPASPLELAVALFVVAATLAVLFAHFRHVALRQYRLVILEPIAYYVLAVALLRDARAMTRALWALIGAGTLVAVLGIGQYLFRYNTLTGVQWVGTTPQPLHLVTSVYGSANNLGLLLDRAIPVAVIVGLGAVAATRERRAGAAGWLAYLPWLAVVPMAAALLLSGSRGGMITAAVVSIAAALLWRGRRDRRLELAGAVVAVAGIAAVLWRVRHGLSTLARVHVWTSALHMIRDHPIFGVGPDNFLYYYFDPKIAIDPSHPLTTNCLPQPHPALTVKHYMLPSAWQEPCLSHPHNVVLDAWLSTGILGLVALALVVIGAAVLAYRAFQSPRAGQARTALVACIAISVATLAHGMVDNSIFLPDLAVDFWLAVALIGTLSATAQSETNERLSATAGKPT